MRTFLFAAAIAVGAIACGTDLSSHVNALTGERCEPDSSYQPKKPPKAGPNNPKCQGTSNGDNCDDLSSGKIDCIGDGNSGQGDDKKHNCMFPQPGCDENGCCDDDIVEPPPGGGDPDDPGDDPTTPPTNPTPPGDEPPGDGDDPPTDPTPPDAPPGSTPPDGTIHPPTGPTGPTPQVDLTRPPTGPIL